MWLFVLYDLPVGNKQQRRAYTRFRTDLEKLGFRMFQFSVYARVCGSVESMETHIKKVKRRLPPEGTVTIMHLTDKQFENIEHFYCRAERKKPKGNQQLEMF
ncbi:MAG: CRISPR-associated endonuclease Cas2 [Bacteroidota bacterium]